MGGDDEVGGSGESVPAKCYLAIAISPRSSDTTHQQIRCFFISQSALAGPYQRFLDSTMSCLRGPGTFHWL